MNVKKAIKSILIASISLMMILPIQRTTAEEMRISQSEINTICERVGNEYCICPELLEAMCQVESNNNPNAVGKDGDTGLMQIIPRCHTVEMKELGVTDLKNPEQNIEVGGLYLSELFDKYGDLPLVLMQYNGTSNAEKKNEDGNFTDYANKIIKLSSQLEREHGK